MRFLLDTDVFVAVVRGHAAASARFTQHLGALHFSAVSVYEAERWLLQPGTPLRYRQGFLTAQRYVSLMDVTGPVAHQAAMLGSDLRRRRHRLGLADPLIAATALEHGLTLVAHPTTPFLPVTGLTLEDWLNP
jgi:tRNA(fMet)-specific endonuclease VapC